MTIRRFNRMDSVILEFDRALSAIFVDSHPGTRPSPAADGTATEPARTDLEVSRGLMRVNHAGEVAAQALYRGQGLTARSWSVSRTMRRAAEEEVDHLNWCRQRLEALGTHSSYLDPLWYAGSFSIGALAGLAGDRWSLGFVAETERQVVAHLQSHLQRIPESDQKSRAVLEQMMADEARHATMAVESGAAELPPGIKTIMKLCSRVMTGTAYWI